MIPRRGMARVEAWAPRSGAELTADRDRIGTGWDLDRFTWKCASLTSSLVLLALLARLVAVHLLPVAPTSERELLYAQLADEWRTSLDFSLDGRPTAVVMPLYPIALGVLRWLNPESWRSVLVLQAIFGALTCWLAFRVAWRVSRNAVVAWSTLALCALYPPLVLACLKLEPLVAYGFLLVLGLWLLTFVLGDSFHIGFYLAAGILFIMGLYLTPRLLVPIPLLALWAGLRAYDRLSGTLGAVALMLACILSLMPWVGRNFLVVGGFIPFTTGSAHALVESLSEAGAQPLGETEGSAGQDEAFQYSAAVKSTLHQIGELEARGWLRIGVRAFPYWVSSYPGLLGGVGEGDGRGSGIEASMVYRAFLLSLTLTLVSLAVLGFFSAFFRVDAWVMAGVLVSATGADVLFNSPPLDHLAYWPLFAVFVSWGGWTAGKWLFRPRVRTPRKTLNGPGGGSPWPDQLELGATPLEPIRGTRTIPPLGGKEDRENEPPRLDPIF